MSETEEVYAELIGKITLVRRKGDFRVYLKESSKYIDCICEFFCPVHEGDVIYGICKVEEKEKVKFIKPPLVKIGIDKESITKFMIKQVAKMKISYGKINKFYEKMLEEAGTEEKVDEQISKLAYLWKEYREENDLKFYNKIIDTKALKTILNKWYKQRSLRRLYLIGLNNKEINKMKKPIYEIYDECVTNPYKVVELTIDKCDEILNRIGKTIDTDERECGVIIRKIYDYMENKGWVGVPSKILSSVTPNVIKYVPKLREEYGVKTELFTVYLEYPYKVEIEVSSFIEKMVNLTIDKKIKNLSYIRTTLSDDQKKAIEGAINNNISIIVGSAGTGKTSIIKEIIHNLELKEISYMLVSFTGKAVARIREVVNRKSPSTMHRLITKTTEVPKFSHLIIDEASMVTTELFYEFIKKFNHNYKITFIGDPNQLEPIGWGCLFEKLIETQRLPTYTLTTIHRTKENGILLNANKIIEYATSPDAEFLPPFDFESSADFQILQGTIDHVNDIIKALHNCGVPADKVTIISPYNRDIVQLNNFYQHIYNNDNKSVIDGRGNLWRLKDRVMMIENDYSINIMNGEEGIITDITTDSLIVTFKDGANHGFKLVPSKVSVFEDDTDTDTASELTVELLSHSSAVSVHRAQGSEWDYVIFYIPENNSNSRFLNRKLIYTALTRAKKAMWCVGDLVSLNLAAVRPPAFRCDNLANRICGIGQQIRLDNVIQI